jgi:hypothetical protein
MNLTALEGIANILLHKMKAQVQERHPMTDLEQHSEGVVDQGTTCSLTFASVRS